MKHHIRALDVSLKPVDVEQGEYHNGPRCAVCGEVNCSSCGNFDTDECPGVTTWDLDQLNTILEQLHRYAALAAQTQAALDKERDLGREAAKTIRRLNIDVANALRGHALADADVANFQYRERLALAQVAELRAELATLRNAEPS